MTQVLERPPELTEHHEDVREVEAQRVTPLYVNRSLVFVRMVVGLLFIGHAARGLWSQNGGFEYNLVLIALLLAVGFMGPGLYSLDRRLPFVMPRPWTFIGALVLTAIVVGVAMLS